MNTNQLGTLSIIGVVVSITAACGGSPTKPTAFSPAIGDNASAPSITLSSPRLVADDQACTSPSPTDAAGDQSGEANAEAAPVMTCEPPAAGEPEDGVVISDSSVMDDLWSAKR